MILNTFTVFARNKAHEQRAPVVIEFWVFLLALFICGKFNGSLL